VREKEKKEAGGKRKIRRRNREREKGRARVGVRERGSVVPRVEEVTFAETPLMPFFFFHE